MPQRPASLPISIWCSRISGGWRKSQTQRVFTAVVLAGFAGSDIADVTGIVPTEVPDLIGRASERAVARDMERYSHWSADEDKASGAIGGTMDEVVKRKKTVDRRS